MTDNETPGAWHVICSECNAEGFYYSVLAPRARETPQHCPVCGAETEQAYPAPDVEVEFDG